MKEINKETKKLNALVAFGCLIYAVDEGRATKNQLNSFKALLLRIDGTPLGKEDGGEQDQIGIQHAIKLIEEYLEEEGV